jgi:hypothetical protein
LRVRMAYQKHGGDDQLIDFDEFSQMVRSSFCCPLLCVCVCVCRSLCAGLGGQWRVPQMMFGCGVDGIPDGMMSFCRLCR